MHVSDSSVTDFDSFDVPEEITRFIGNNNIVTNIFRKQFYESITCGYFCFKFIDFMFKLDIFYLFFPHNFQKNDKVILDYCLK